MLNVIRKYGFSKIEAMLLAREIADKMFKADESNKLACLDNLTDMDIFKNIVGEKEYDSIEYKMIRGMNNSCTFNDELTASLVSAYNSYVRPHLNLSSELYMKVISSDEIEKNILYIKDIIYKDVFFNYEVNYSGLILKLGDVKLNPNSGKAQEMLIHFLCYLDNAGLYMRFIDPISQLKVERNYSFEQIDKRADFKQQIKSDLTSIASLYSYGNNDLKVKLLNMIRVEVVRCICNIKSDSWIESLTKSFGATAKSSYQITEQYRNALDNIKYAVESMDK